jgi:hypothetical protein
MGSRKTAARRICAGSADGLAAASGGGGCGRERTHLFERQRRLQLRELAVKVQAVLGAARLAQVRRQVDELHHHVLVVGREEAAARGRTRGGEEHWGARAQAAEACTGRRHTGAQTRHDHAPAHAPRRQHLGQVLARIALRAGRSSGRGAQRRSGGGREAADRRERWRARLSERARARARRGAAAAGARTHAVANLLQVARAQPAGRGERAAVAAEQWRQRARARALGRA